MYLCTIVSETSLGGSDKTGCVFPFGVFDTIELAESAFIEEKKKPNSIFTETDVLMYEEVTLNKPINIDNNNSEDKLLLSYCIIN